MRKSPKSVGGRKTFERLNYKERVIIENRYCIDKKSIRDIAKELGRPPSAVSREIDGRPRIGRGKYTADKGQQKAEDKRANQGRKSKFNHLHRNGNEVLKKNCEDLRKYLTRRHTRRQKKGLRKAQKLERLTALPSIEDRPPEVAKRKKIGHWEDDTLVSRQSKNRIKSVNERVSGITLFGKTSNGTACACDKVVIDRLKKIPPDFRKTLTRDRGTENLDYKNIEKELSLKCFFAYPYCSHERGSNENAVIERSFRTDQDEFFYWQYKGAKDLNDLNNQFQLFLQEYNFKRPHLSLDLMTPIEKIKSYS